MNILKTFIILSLIMLAAASNGFADWDQWLLAYEGDSDSDDIYCRNYNSGKFKIELYLTCDNFTTGTAWGYAEGEIVATGAITETTTASLSETWIYPSMGGGMYHYKHVGPWEQTWNPVNFAGSVEVEVGKSDPGDAEPSGHAIIYKDEFY